MAKKNTSYILGVLIGLLLCSNIFAQKKQRVIHIWYDEPITDSTRRTDSINLYYSGNRGSVFNFNHFEASYYGFRPHNITGSSIYPACILPAPVRDVFLQDAQPDSIYRKSTFITKPGSIFTYENIYMQYAGDTLPADMRTSRSMTHPASRTTTLYNEAGLPITNYSLLLNTINQHMDTLTVRHIHYDANKRVVADTFREPGGHMRTTVQYTYDSLGRPTHVSENKTSPGGSIDIRIKHFTYNAAGSIIQTQYSWFDEDVLVPLGKEEMQYDSENRLTNIAAYDKHGRITYNRSIAYNNTGDLHRQEVTYYSNWMVSSCEWTEFYFNSFHNPDSAVTWKNHCNRGFTKKATTIYVYETYGEDPPGFQPMRKAFIYPVPARVVVHIRWHRDFSNTGLELKLYNAAGQEMRRYSIDNPKWTDDFNISGLAAGTYLLRINTAITNEYVYSGKIVVL